MNSTHKQMLSQVWVKFHLGQLLWWIWPFWAQRTHPKDRVMVGVLWLVRSSGGILEETFTNWSLIVLAMVTWSSSLNPWTGIRSSDLVLPSHWFNLLRDGFKTQPPVDWRFRPVLPGFYCSKEWQPPQTGQNHQSTSGWVLKPPLMPLSWICLLKNAC